MIKNLPKRKPLRLLEYDYSQGNAYFLTVCTKDRLPLFWTNTRLENPEAVPLSDAGIIVRDCMLQIPDRYQGVAVEKYCIMPDHVHLLLMIVGADGGRPMVVPTVSRVMQQFKGSVSKLVGTVVWQKSYYDHAIRNDADFLACWQYIDNNPLKYEVKLCL